VFVVCAMASPRVDRLGCSVKTRRGHVRRQGRLLALLTSGFCLAAVFLARCSAFAGAAGPCRGGSRRQANIVGRRQGSGQAASSYQGVSWHEASHKWMASLSDPAKGVVIALGIFEVQTDAAKAFDQASLAILGPGASTNFPASKYEAADIEEAGRRVKSFWEPRASTKYNGVYRTRGSTLWHAEISLGKHRQFIDLFETEEAAARAHDEAVRDTKAPKAVQLTMLNFKQPDDYFDEDTWEDEQAPREASSVFIGVDYHSPSGNYRAKKGLRPLGLFPTEIEAARAFDKASLSKGGPTNFMPPPSIAEERA